MPERIAITGASGFLGGYLFRHLRATGADVTGYARSPIDDLETVSDYAEVQAADVIVHCAEISDAAQVQQAGDAYSDKALATLGTLTGKAGRVVYASSAMVYGDAAARARKTNETVTAHHPYMRLKLAAEMLVRNAGGVSLRLANLCGPGQPSGTVLSDIIGQLGEPGPLLIRNTAAVRDFLWLPDVARLVSRVLERPNLPTVLNAGSGFGLGIGELAARVLKIAGEEGREIRSLTVPRETSLWMDIEETSRLLNWAPEVTLEQGVASLLAKGASS